MSNNSLRHRPTVVFVDDDQWECFFHLAVMLHKARIRTVRVSVGLPRWQPENMLFDRHVSLSSIPTPRQLADILSEEYVTDIQVTESLAETTYAALGLLPISQRSDIWSGRAEFLDKWKVATKLREIGLQTPDTLLVESHSPDEAIASFSLPIVLKSRVGASGTGVEVFDSLDVLREFVSKIDKPSDWFYERFVQGESYVCALCVGDDGIDVIATYETVERIHFRGPSIVTIIRDEPSIVDIGRTLTAEVHTRGFVCFDVIRDSTGTNWIHDVNLRVFGTFSMCQLVGFDFRGAYLKCLTGGGVVESKHTFELGSRTFTFPSGLKAVLHSGQSGSDWLRTIRWIWRFEKLLGFRYFLSWALSSCSRGAERVTGKAGEFRS